MAAAPYLAQYALAGVRYMALFSKKGGGSKRSRRRLVVTGKRIKGSWSMESVLPLEAKRSREGSAPLRTENRRVRTLH